MSVRTKVPQLNNPDIVIRLAQNQEEIETANELVLRSYLDVGLWEDEKEFHNNKHIHSPMRTTIVAAERDKIIGTISTIKDSKIGLPADKFQPGIMKRLRGNGERIAELTALAVDKSASEHYRTLVLFLYKFVQQHTFYYAGMDRFIATVTPKHAVFYESVCCFERLSSTSNYSYVKLAVQFVAQHLVLAHKHYSDRYETDPADRNNFYRFLLVDEHPNLLFPDKKLLRRSREIDWVSQARLIEMPMAV